MNVGLAVDPVILAGAALLALGVVAGGVAQRLRVPSLVLFLALGMLIGDDGLELIEFSDARLAQSLAVIALVVILFDGGLSMPAQGLRTILAPSAVLATVGVVVTSAVVAAFAFCILDLDATTAALIGVVVSSTDAAAVFGVLRGLPVPARLRHLVEAESGLNDPMAVLLTIGVLESWRANPSVGDWLRFGVVQLVGGAIVGIVVGVLGARLLCRLRLAAASGYPVLALALAGVSFGVAAELGASGFLAVYLTGVVIADRVPRHHRAIVSFHEALGSTAQIVLFFLLGILVFPSELPDVAWRALAIAAVLVLLARPIAALAALVWFRFRPAELAFASWAGLRGAVPIVLATYPLTAGYPQGRLIFNVVFFVVLVSAVVQGGTVAWVARRLGLRADAAAVGPLAEIVPTDTLDADVVRLELGSGCGVIGRPIAEVPLPGGARIAVLVRGQRSLVPDGGTVLEAGDTVLVAVTPGAPVGALLAWATSGDAG